MAMPSLKTLETCAAAAGSAFGFDEAAFEARPASAGRTADIDAPVSDGLRGSLSAFLRACGFGDFRLPSGNARAAI
jgi:hypothetical protein